MSNFKVTAVKSLIASLITTVEAIEKLYDAAKNERGQPQAFRRVAARLPLIIDLLRRAEEIASALDESVLETTKELLVSCKLNTEKVRAIFEEVTLKNGESLYIRYKKAVGTLRKGDTLESLMEEILTDIQLLANGSVIRAATNDQAKQLEDSIKEMREMPDSLPVEAAFVNQTHIGGGDNIGTMNIHRGKGDVYHNVFSGGANFGSRK